MAFFRTTSSASLAATVAAVSCLLLGAASREAQGQGNPAGHVTIATKNGNAEFSNSYGFGTPMTVTNEGQVVFLNKSFSQAGLWKGGGGAVTRLMEEGGQAPGGGVFSRIDGDNLWANRAGDIVMVATSNIGGVHKDGLFLFKSGVWHRLAYEGESAPAGGTYKDFDSGWSAPGISADGKVVFYAEATVIGQGLYLGEVTGSTPSVKKIAVVGDPAPSGGFFNRLAGAWESQWAIDTQGRIVFEASATGIAHGLYSYDGQMIRYVPGSEWTDDLMMNNAGQMAFTRMGATGSDILISYGTAESTEVILRGGDPAPGGGTFSSVSGLSINEGGQVAFSAKLSGAPAYEGVFVWDTSGFRKIAHLTGPAPGGGIFGGGFFSDVQNRVFITNTGWVYWISHTSGGLAIFAGDGNVLQRVIGVGEGLAGSQISDIYLVPESNTYVPTHVSGQGGVNDAGQVAYRASLTQNGNEGVFLFTPPTGWGASPEREIAVQQPDLVAVSDGGARSFGKSATGTPVSLTFSIKNTGLTPLTGVSASISGTHAGDYAITTQPASTVAGPAGATSVTVRFTPQAAGLRTALLQIASNDADENPYDITLIGTGIAPEIAVEQPSGMGLASGTSEVAFGTVTAGSSSAAKTFVIRNHGEGTLVLGAVTRNGGQPGDFVLNTSAMATTVGPGGSTAFSVTFTPQGNGARATQLRIANNDADENPFIVLLSGTGSAPEIEVEHPAGMGLVDGAGQITFGTTLVGTSTAETVVVVKNTGDAPLTLSGVTRNGGHAADFTVNTSGMAGVLSPGQSTQFGVAFAPIGTGPRSSTLRIASNDGDENPFDITLSGLGIAPEIAVEEPLGTDRPSGTAIGFGSLEVGTQAAPRTFTIRNLGEAPLTLSGVSRTGAHESDFVVNTSGMASSLGMGESTSFTVTFGPTGAGNRAAMLQIGNNDGNENPFVLMLNGFGRRAEIGVESPEGQPLPDGSGVLDLGGVGVGSTGPLKVVTIRNTGETPLTISGFTNSGAHPAEFLVNSGSLVSPLAPGGSTTFTVAFVPGGTGPRNAMLHIANDDADEDPYDLTLSGTGVSNTLPVVTLLGSHPLVFEAAASYTDAGATAQDAEDGPLTPVMSANNVLANRPGTYQVTWSATDSLSGKASAVRSVQVVDTTAPALTVPADIDVTATSATGAVVTYPNAVATDIVGVTSLTYSQAKGSSFPIGKTVVTVTARDAAANTVQATFLVTVRPGNLDKKAPVVQITQPTAKAKTVAGTYSVTGLVRETHTLASFRVTINGQPVALDSPMDLNVTTSAPWQVSGIEPENGPNFIVAEAVDLAGRTGRAAKTVTYTRVRPELAGLYTALVSPAGAVGNDTLGFIQLSVTDKGSFSGSLLLGGAAFPLSGVLANDGSARFKTAWAGTQELRLGKGASLRSLGHVSLSVSQAGGLTGGVSGTAGGSGDLAAFNGPRAPYSKASRLPVDSALLNLPVGKPLTSGRYALALGSQGTGGWPQGDGYASLSLNNLGVLTLLGFHADGTKVTGSARLREDHTAVVFARLYGNKGAFGGRLVFADEPDSDVAGTNLLWVRPPNPKSRSYPLGWPAGIAVDAAGTFFTPPASRDFGQGPADFVQGNAALVFEEGRLSAPLRLPVSVDPATGRVARPATHAAAYTLGLNAASGVFSGTVRHEDGTKPVFRGILLNKGVNRGGFGYFLGPGVGAESGAVFLDPQGP